MKRKLLESMMAVVALFATSCSSELAMEEAPNSEVNGEEVEVTFSVSAMNSHAAMRDATESKGPGQWQSYIGKGQEIDMLIYAVYEYDKKEGYTLLTQYGLGTVDQTLTPSTEVFKDAEAMKGSNHEGQTIVDVSQTIQNGESQEITLRLMRNKQYHIAFWAQSSKTAAFNTDNLEKVQVIYANAKNNDELRDAFCKVESFSVGIGSGTRTVVLTRPMAQINVGTTGADYKVVMQDKDRTFTQSQFTLSGVAQYLNVVTDQVLTKDEDGTSNLLDNVVFGFNKIPAYIKVSEAPEDMVGSDENNTIGEEFLIVDFDGNKEIQKYKTSYPTLGENNAFLTETFKYISMCYVLVPASPVVIPDYDESGETKDPDPYTSSVLKDLSLKIAQTKEDGSEKDPAQSVKLENVPVHRNWRTNILCGLNAKNIEDPNDNPNQDDDPTSIYLTPYALVSLDSSYDGEHNTTSGGSSWMESTFTGASGN